MFKERGHFQGSCLSERQVAETGRGGRRHGPEGHGKEGRSRNVGNLLILTWLLRGAWVLELIEEVSREACEQTKTALVMTRSRRLAVGVERSGEIVI